MARITLKDLIETLRKASAHPKAHSPAQQSFFSRLRSDSVLVNCGSACCVAGDLMLKAHQDCSEQRLDDIIRYCYGSNSPGEWVTNELGLSDAEETLAFNAYTHHEIHSLLADLLEAGLRLPDVDVVGLSDFSTYTTFDWAYLENEDKYLKLKELKDWMIAIAK
jgi:hypothetical protein